MDDSEWNRPKAGRGTPLRPLPRDAGMSRTRFEHREGPSLVSVDVDHDTERVGLFRDGVEVARGTMPVRFDLAEGVLEVSASMYGLRRMHLVRADGEERLLTPAVGTAEYRRAEFGRRFPRLGRALGIAAIIVLVIDLVLLAPQLLEIITRIELWPWGEFVSPIVLPGPLNAALIVAGIFAAIERAMTFRHHRLLDAQTDFI